MIINHVNSIVLNTYRSFGCDLEHSVVEENKVLKLVGSLTKIMRGSPDVNSSFARGNSRSRVCRITHIGPSEFW